MNTLPLMERRPGDLLAWVDERPVQVSEFLGLSRELAASLPDRHYVINLCRDRFWFAVAFAAAIRSGKTTLLPPNRLPATVEELISDYPDAVVIGDADGPARRPGALDPRLAWGTGDCGAETIPDIPVCLPAAIVFTSGSTGHGKPIRKTWLTLAESSRLNARSLDARRPHRHLLATVPPQHMWGLETSVLIPWFAAVTVSNTHPFFPEEIINRLRALPAPRVLVSTPVHLRSLLTHLGSESLPAEAIWSSTAPLDPRLAAGLAVRGPAQVTEIYGCSETGCLARRNPASDEAWEAFDAFHFSPAGGRSRVRAAHLPGSVELQDYLEMETGGRFRLVGRSEDLVNIAGKRASLADLNQRLLRIPGVLDGVIFQPPEAPNDKVQRLAALVVAPGLSGQRIRAELHTRIDAAFIPRPLRLVPALPRAESGKLSRRAVLDLFGQTTTSVHEPA